MLFIVFFTSHRSPLSERLEQATSVRDRSPEVSINCSSTSGFNFWEQKRNATETFIYFFLHKSIRAYQALFLLKFIHFLSWISGNVSDHVNFSILFLLHNIGNFSNSAVLLQGYYLHFKKYRKCRVSNNTCYVSVVKIKIVFRRFKNGNF